MAAVVQPSYSIREAGRHKMGEARDAEEVLVQVLGCNPGGADGGMKGELWASLTFEEKIMQLFLVGINR